MHSCVISFVITYVDFHLPDVDVIYCTGLNSVCPVFWPVYICSCVPADLGGWLSISILNGLHCLYMAFNWVEGIGCTASLYLHVMHSHHQHCQQHYYNNNCFVHQ